MKAAHLVPKSLQSDELSYLFGVGEIDLNDPRNGTLVFRILLPPTLQKSFSQTIFDLVSCKTKS